MSDNFSFSKIDQFIRCPYAYKLTNIEQHDKYLRNYSMVRGIIAHRFMELSWKNSPEKVKEKLYEEYKDYKLINEIENELKQYIPQIYEHTVEAELPMIFNLGPYKMRGIIDRLDKIDKEYMIVDYKYGFYEYTEDDLNNSIQLSIYAYNIMDMYNLDHCSIAYHNLKQKTFFSKELKKSDIDTSSILSFINAIRSSELLDDFPPRISSNCVNCVVRSGCKPFKDWLSESINELDPNVEIEDIADYYFNLQEKEKAYRYQKKTLDVLLEEIYKSNIDLEKYEINVSKYGNLELKKIK